MNYNQYSAEDFAADDSFKLWVCKPSAQSDAFWEAFLAQYPERYYQVEEGRRLVAGLGQLPQPPVLDSQVNRIWSRIEGTLGVAQARPNPARHIPWRALAWAASVLLVLGLGWWWSLPTDSPGPLVHAPVSDPGQEWKESSNEGDKTMDIQLADGSRILLGKHSQLRYPVRFSAAKREVYLTGNAFFDIRKNPDKPFLVHANGLVTKVLGTRFHINANHDDPDVTVSVQSGRVSVYTDADRPARDPESEGVVLTPNQKAVFQRKEATISKTVVEKPVLLIPESKKTLFAFEATPAHQVFESLEKAYGIKVVYDEDLLRTCTLTFNLTEENLFQKLEVICKVLGAEYKLIDGQVIIYSKGC
jgi:transmembrane sensor